MLSLILALQLFANGANDHGKKKKDKEPSRLESAVRHLPDSLFKPVVKEDLLDDQVYLKLAQEGWTREEIINIMNTALKDKKSAKKKVGYGWYAKQWLPIVGRQAGADSIFEYIDTTYTQEMQRSVKKTVPEDLYNAYWEPIPYSPDDRKNGIRRPGYFRNANLHPSVGRTHWLAMHPEDPDKLYVVADGTGIFKTDDCGKHWDCITDRIPDRENRNNSNGYAIPVDPDDWNHVFAFMNNSSVYESMDGGQSWSRIVGATHKGFKRGDCFRGKDGKLKFVGCTRTGNTWISSIWISEDMCKTWTEVRPSDDIKDRNPKDGTKGAWFQYIVPDPSDRDRIYFPTSRAIYYFDDGARSEEVNGKKVYNLKRLHFEVYEEDGVTRSYPKYEGDDPNDPNYDAIFPLPAQAVGDLQINPNNPDEMWFGTGSQITGTTAIYKSEDHGKTWRTIHDPANGVGEGMAFGDEMMYVWLGGFGVNFQNTNKVHGTTFATARSTDGGRTFGRLGWHTSLRVPYEAQDNGGGLGTTNTGLIPVAASRHNADNHFIRSHKTGRVYRGCDAGLVMCQDDMNEGEWMYVGETGMSNMLFYGVAVNEFGDQMMAGNTQDVDGQTYRYGRWGRWRGYEGSECFVNPYTSTVYLPNLGWEGWDPSQMSMDSWRNARTRADVVTGSWFMTRSGMSGKSLIRVDDLGHTIVNLEQVLGVGVPLTGHMGLCRDQGRCTVYVITNANAIMRSLDAGNTWEQVMVDGRPAVFSGSVIATDPNNSDICYVGQSANKSTNTHVMKIDVKNQKYTELTTAGLPEKLGISQLMFHEGSGDLYFYAAGGAGFYILEYDKASDTYPGPWRFWTKGYNINKSNHAEINYTTQEMVISDYGRGVWVADLEHPSDRYFSDGFNLKEFSFLDGRRTIGIDTEWIIPLYYYFKWTVNGEEVTDSPYQYLRKALNPGDKVQLELTLRESPDVHTISAEYVIPEAGERPGSDNPNVNPDTQDPVLTYDNAARKEPGRALYSDGQGRVDLGYQDYFFNDFTIDFWLKPVTDGVVLANKGRVGDVKGWEIALDRGNLNFEYYPRNYVVKAHNVDLGTQNDKISAPGIQYGKWQHIAVTHQRNGNITLFINGRQIASKQRIIPEATLNNSCILSLFGDAIETNTVEATIDELKIWNHALTADNVRKEMYSTNCNNADGLVAYFPFNAGSLDQDRETFSRKPIRSRIRANVQYQPMSVPTCARKVSLENINSEAHTFTVDGVNMLGISSPQSEGEEPAPNVAAGQYAVYAYDASQWQNEEDNLDTDYYDYHSVGYMIHGFDETPSDAKILVDFYPMDSEKQFDATKTYRLYVTDIESDKQVWQMIGQAKYEQVGDQGVVRVSDVSLADLADKKLLIVTTRPSVEIKVDAVGPDGVLSVYNESMSVFPLSANLLSGATEPSGVYEIEPDGIIRPSGLYFTKGVARGELRLDLSQLGDFNTSVFATVKSNENNYVEVDENGVQKTRPALIPLPLEVRNRIAPKKFGNGIKLLDSYARVGTPTTYEGLSGSKELTMMGWVRIDSIKNIENANAYLMMIRDHNNYTNGFRLYNGKMIVMINGSSQGKNMSDVVMSPEDIGRWKHLAFVLSETEGLNFYVNGEKVTSYPKFKYTNVDFNNEIRKGLGYLCLGKNSGISDNYTDDDKFCGAFDQVGVWRRALSDEEVVKYMYNVPQLNDDGLLSYTDMDYASEQTRRDLVTMGEVKLVENARLMGSASFEEPTPIPCDARTSSQITDADSPISITFPEGKNRKAIVSTFRGTPYCYLNHDFQNYTALNQEFYGLTYMDKLTTTTTPVAEDNVTVSYRHRTVRAGENLALAIRRTGTLEHLAGFIPASSVEDGVATFIVPAISLKDASEMMIFSNPDDPNAPGTSQLAYIQLAFGPAISSKLVLVDVEDEKIPRITFTEDMCSADGKYTVPVIADVISQPRNCANEVTLVVDEISYASLSQPSVDLSKPENIFKIEIEKEKIDKFGVNPLTINIAGATANELKLQFCLEPRVELTLLNGDEREVLSPGNDGTGDGNSQEKPDDPNPWDNDPNDPNDPNASQSSQQSSAGQDAGNKTNAMRVSTPTATLNVKAELVEGFLKKGQEVKLDIITDLNNSLSIGSGNLLMNEEVRYEDLVYSPLDVGEMHDGWNLIGNPYLTDINLTKDKNVEYDPSEITKFIFQCNPSTGNYEVYDMTNYEASQKIHPFQAYFVQTMSPDATFTVTPVAKETTPTKRTMAYNLEETNRLVFGLYDGDVKYDQVTINFDLESNNCYVKNEDAPKLFNITGSSPELFAYTKEEYDEMGVEVAITSTSGYSTDLGFKSGNRSGDLTLRLDSRSGLSDFNIFVHDNLTNKEYDVATTPMFSFPVSQASGSPAKAASEASGSHRFTVSFRSMITGASAPAASGYCIYVEHQSCLVTGLQGDAQVNVYTLNGQSVFSTHTAQKELAFTLQPGYYIVVINENGKEFNSKILVQ